MKPELNIEKIEGKGTPIVFIHGWMGRKDVWDQVRGKLEVENPLIFYDQRCHGKSTCSKFSIEDLARDLETITEEMEEPVVAGHSMGGMTALKYSTLSENFSGLLLFATSASTPETEYKSPKFLLSQIDRVAKEKLSSITADNKDKEEDSQKNTFAGSGLKNMLKTGRKPFTHGLNAMRNYDIREELEEETALVVAGEEDKVIPSKQSKKVAELLNCRFTLIDSSHRMLQEKPEKIAEITQKFMKNLKK